MEVFRFCNKGVRQRLWAEGLTSGVPRPVGSSSDGVCARWGFPQTRGGVPDKPLTDLGSKSLEKNFHKACIGLAQGNHHQA